MDPVHHRFFFGQPAPDDYLDNNNFAGSIYAFDENGTLRGTYRRFRFLPYDTLGYTQPIAVDPAARRLWISSDGADLTPFAY